MLKNRNLSIAKLVGSDKGNEYEVATVIATGNKTVDIKMLTGGIYRRVPVSGSANVGDQVNVLFLKGKPTVIAGGSGVGGGSQIIINSGAAEAPAGNYAPSPHDAIGGHHSWPANASGQFLITTSTPGAPAFRSIALSDIQTPADSRYALRSRIINAGDGLIGTGPLTSDITLAVNPGDGIEIVSDAVKVKLNATASGLSLDASGLAVADSIAGSGIGISAGKVLSIGAANTIVDSTPSFQGLQADADGLRIYASSAPGAAAHILASNGSGRLTLPLYVATTSVSTPSLISAASTDIVLSPGSNLVKLAASKVLQSDGYASQTTGMRITHSGEGDFRYIYTDELHAKSFIADLEQALAGGQIISKSVAVLAAQYTLPAAGGSSQFTVNDLPSAKGMRAFETGDFIGFRQFDRSGGGLSIGWAWGTVSSYVDNLDGTQSWTFTRSAAPNAGIASGNIQKDSIVLDFGKSGNGYHEVNAIDGLQGANSPYSQIVTWATHPSTRTVRTRIGNLRGLFGASGQSVYSLVIQNATGGNFTVQIGEERTSSIAYNASAATVAAAINGIIAGATVSLGIVGTTYTYTINIPSSYSYLPFAVNGNNITGTTALDVACTLTSQTDSEFGLYAGEGTNIDDRYIRISDTTVEFRNTPVKLYDGVNETMRLWAGTGNDSPSFAMGYPLPTGPLTNSTGVWMGLSGGLYQLRVGAANGTALTGGMHWTGSQLNIIGAVRLSGNTYATPSESGLYADSARIGYYNSAAEQGGWRSWFDSSGNLTMKAAPVASGTNATGIEFTSSNGVLRGGYYTAAAGPSYGSFVTQWQTDANNGAITAGGGDVTMSSTGLSLKLVASDTGLTANVNTVRWAANNFNDTTGVLYQARSSPVASTTWLVARSDDQVSTINSVALQARQGSVSGVMRYGTITVEGDGQNNKSNVRMLTHRVDIGTTDGQGTTDIHIVGGLAIYSSANQMPIAGYNNVTAGSLRFGQDTSISRKTANVLSLGASDALESYQYASFNGWRIDSTGSADFNNVRIRGSISASVFEVDEVHASAGTLGIYKNASTLYEGFTSSSSINGNTDAKIKNSELGIPTFDVNDIVHIRVRTSTALATCWFRVDTRTASTQFTTYSLKLLSGSANASFGAGTAVTSFGASGSAIITLSADNTIPKPPNISLFTHSGQPWSSLTMYARMGNLKGRYGFAGGAGDPDIYGFAAGDESGTFISADSTNGLKIKKSNVERFSVNTSGDVEISDAAGTPRVTIDTTGLKIKNSSGTDVITLNQTGSATIAGYLNIGSSGGIYEGTVGTGGSPNTGLRVRTNNGYGVIELWKSGSVGGVLGNLRDQFGYGANDIYGLAIGNNSATVVSAEDVNGFRVRRAGVTRFQVNNAGDVTLNNASGTSVIVLDDAGSRIDNVLNIGTNGEIRQGTGSLTASPATFTGLRVWSELSSGNYFGRIAGYNNGTLQWYAGTDGKLYAGGTKVQLSSAGVSVKSNPGPKGTGWAITDGYRFDSASSPAFLGLYSSTNDTVEDTLMLMNEGAYGSRIVQISGVSTDPQSTEAGVVLIAQNTSTTTTLHVRGNGVTIEQPAKLLFGTVQAPDVNLYRDSADVLKTDDSFVVASALFAASGSFTGSVTVGSTSGGLNVGTTGATAGQVKASAGISGTTGTFTGAVTIGGLSVSDQLRVNSHARVQAPLSSGTSFDRVLFGSNVAWDETSALWSINNIGANDAGAIIFANTATIDFILHASTGASARTMDNATFKAGRKMRLDSSGRLGIGTTPSYRLDVAGDARVTGDLTLSAADIITDTTTGTRLGTSATQKIGFYGATAVIQRSGAAQVAVATTGATQTTPFGFTTAAQANAIVTLLNEIRAALVAVGLIKGSA